MIYDVLVKWFYSIMLGSYEENNWIWRKKFQEPDFFAWVDSYVDYERWFHLLTKCGQIRNLKYWSNYNSQRNCAVWGEILEYSGSGMWWIAGTDVGDFETQMKTIGFSVRDESHIYKRYALQLLNLSPICKRENAIERSEWCLLCSSWLSDMTCENCCIVCLFLAWVVLHCYNDVEG